MSGQYSRDHCKIAVGKILQTIGWHSINSTPLEVLTDILSKYITQITKLTNDYANEFGQTEPNLDHLGLAFQELGVNLQELEEYVTFVNFAPSANPVPKYPLPKESNLNFLKPGSKEVVTRPVHIHEHLPPMYPLLEGSDNDNENGSITKKESTDEENAEQFKKPADISSPEFKRLRREDEGGRPTREISSVMMTTSGFLSPAREGKLPEARTPAPPPEPVRPPTPDINRKKPEKKKEKIGKELFKPVPEEKAMKKIPTMKDVFKMKQMKAAAAAAAVVANPNNPQLPIPQLPQPLPLPPGTDVRVAPVLQNKNAISKTNFSKALAAAKAKTEKLNTTITPIPMRAEAVHTPLSVPSQIDKLFTEPDKKKVNIFKKISNVKEKGDNKPVFRPHLNPHFIDEPNDIVSKINLSGDITIEPIHTMPAARTPEKIESYFDDGSPPGTPSTPKTPEIISHSPPVPKEKRKRKDKTKVKKFKKHQNFLDNDIIDITLERPKTPEAHLVMRQLPPQFPIPPMAHTPQLPFPFPLANFGGPGLIPTPLNNHLFPFSHLPNMPNFGKNPYFPPVHQNIPPPLEPVPRPRVSPKVKEHVRSTPPEPQPPPPQPPAEIIPRVPTPTPPPLPAPAPPPPPPTQLSQPLPVKEVITVPTEPLKKTKEHKKEKKDKIKKKSKKDKIKDKSEKKKVKEAKKEKIKKEKKDKKKELKETESPIPKIFLKVNSPSPRPETPETMKKLNIKPVLRKEESAGTSEERKREPSPGLAKISALVTGPPKQKTASPVAPPIEKPVVPEVPPPVVVPRTPGRPRIHPIKPKPTPPKPKKVEQTFVKKDEHGNEVWICPACGQQDDGRPMIGCDGCDAWYHWVCVGIQVPPDENENWYCKPCLCKKNEDLQDKRKRRKRKEKKDH